MRLARAGKLRWRLLLLVGLAAIPVLGLIRTNLEQNAFAKPEWLNNEPILRQVEDSGAVSQMQSIQVRHLNALLHPGRLERLVEATLTGERHG